MVVTGSAIWHCGIYGLFILRQRLPWRVVLDQVGARLAARGGHGAGVTHG